MQRSLYEQHVHIDPDIPFLFFGGESSQLVTNKYMHWHEDMEILQFTDDSGIVFCNGQCVEPKTGDVVVIKPNTLHTVCTKAEKVSYYCLIVDKSFYEHQKLPLAGMNFQTMIRSDGELERLFAELVNEVYSREAFYKQKMKVDVIGMLIHICRRYQMEDGTLPEQQNDHKKEAIVKEVIRYLQHHYAEKISMEELSRKMGFSYYYLSHVFKELTMLTIVEYIQQLRCNYAMQLLTSMELSVSEVAEQVGFNNISYFSKIYKRFMGHLPSEEMQNQKK